MQQLSDPGDIISSSWENFTRNFRTYIDFAVWFVLLAVIKWGLSITVRGMFDDPLMRSVVLAIVTLPVWLATMALLAALIDATYQGVQRKPVSARASFSHGLHKLIPYVVVSVLLFLTYVCGFILLFIPLFIFAVWFWFAPFFTVIDDMHSTASMSASKQLVRGRWWATAMRLLLPAVFFLVAGEFAKQVLFLVLGLVFGDPGSFVDNILLTDAISNTQLLLQSVVLTAVNAFLFPLVYGSNLLLWIDLKRTK